MTERIDTEGAPDPADCPIGQGAVDESGTIGGSDNTGSQDAIVPACAAGRLDLPRHGLVPEPFIEAPTVLPALTDLDNGSSEFEDVPNGDIFLYQAERRDILAEGSRFREDIGRALAEQLHARGNTVIIAARRTAVLQDIASKFTNMHAMTVDVRDPYSVKRLTREIAEAHPGLNIVFNNAGIMRPENVFDSDAALAESNDHIETNLNGPIRLTAALLPHLAKQPRARIVNASSGLAFVPRAPFPTYCATKAGVHSYSVSLRHQLRKTPIDLLELASPALRTELTGQSRIEAFMPLPDSINEVSVCI